MNLAEIRKKARQEKAGESQTAGSSPPTESSPVAEPSLDPAPDAGKCDDFAESDTIPVLAEDEPPQNGASGEFAVKVVGGKIAEEYRPGFDPLAIILAGRRAAGKVSDTVEVAHTETHEVVGESRKFIRFRVADEEYGLSLLEIREIIKPREVTEVPGMPEFVAGIISLRGTIIPIFDLRLRLGLAANERTGQERIIIARNREGSVGLLVDEVFQVINLSMTAIEKAPAVLEGIDREFVTGLGRHGQRMLILLDLEKILDISLQ